MVWFGHGKEQSRKQARMGGGVRSHKNRYNGMAADGGGTESGMAVWEAVKALWEREWEPLSKAAWIGWLAFYGLFILYALTNRDGYLLE